MVKTTELSNGIRCVTHQVENTQLVHCGFILDIGSLDEQDHQLGIAHFWEHLAFKGTKNRDAKQIIYSLERYGGEINAFTSKEKICLYATVLEDYVEEAVEILVDITFNSIFPEAEIEMERNIILEEMSMYLNSPEDAILDHFDSMVFENHRLGSNILGTVSTINRIKQKDFVQFVEENMSTNSIVFSLVSSFSDEKIKGLLYKYLEIINKKIIVKKKRQPYKNNLFEPKRRTFYNSKSQSQIVLGCPCYGRNDERRIPFYILNNALGGPTLVSKLNYNLRELKGLVYNVESVYHTYETTGLFYITFGTANEKVESTIIETNKIINDLMTNINDDFLNQSKQQLKGQFAMAEENNLAQMISHGKSILDWNSVKTIADTFKVIEEVTLSELKDVAYDMFSKTLSVLIYHSTNKI